MLGCVHPQTVNLVPLGKQCWFDSNHTHQIKPLWWNGRHRRLKISRFWRMKQTMNEILLSLLGSQELVERWWATPNKAFDGEIPDDLLHTPRKIEVYKYIMAQVSSHYS
jgi:hypothetical protein